MVKGFNILKSYYKNVHYCTCILNKKNHEEFFKS